LAFQESQFPTTRIQYVHDNQEGFSRIEIGLKGQRKEVGKWFGKCGAKRKKKA